MIDFQPLENLWMSRGMIWMLSLRTLERAVF
jgi:hypothetical protein